MKIRSLFKNSASMGWFGFVSLCAVVSALLTVTLSTIPQNIEVGQVAKRDIKAARNYEIVDQEATDKFQQEALKNVFPVFDFDEGVQTEAQDKMDRAFVQIESQLGEFGIKQKHLTAAALSADQENALRQGVETVLGVALGKAEWDVLLRARTSVGLKSLLKNLLETLLSQPIVANKQALEEFKETGITLRNVRGKSEKQIGNMQEILTLEEAKLKLTQSSSIHSFGIDRSLLPTWIGLAQKFAAQNVTYNREETESRREEALRNVKNVVIKIQAGEAIIRAGARYEPWHVKVLEGIQKERELGTGPLRFLGTFLFVFLGLGTTFYFSERFVKRFAPKRKDYILMGITVIGILLLTRISLTLAAALRDSLFYNVSYTALYYAIPIAAGAMLIRIFLSAEIALILSVVLSLLAGLAIGNDANYTAYCLISAIAGSGAIAKADHRSAIMKAGFYTGLINAAAVLGILLIQVASVTKPFTFVSVLAHISFAMLGGFFSSIVVFVFMPLVETALGYTSDIKLLELANLNHPLLKELIIRAPGTYHHSHIIGILAEAAAEAIGANALLARVGAYYHDIGKIKKPSYYIENVREGASPHEQLNPHMSALVVQAHVKEGIALAKEYALPQSIVDMIPQHHGTKRISFFYEKAKELEDPEVQVVDEKDFRYPGPKPQTREAGILMLADATKATVRALKEKSPTRIQQTVEKVINKSFAEAQLDECDLTLRDLNEIGKSFIRILLGLYHQRIEYPPETLQHSGEGIRVEGEEKKEGGTTGSAADEDRPPNVRRLQFPDR